MIVSAIDFANVFTHSYPTANLKWINDVLHQQWVFETTHQNTVTREIEWIEVYREYTTCQTSVA